MKKFFNLLLSLAILFLAAFFIQTRFLPPETNLLPTKIPDSSSEKDKIDELFQSLKESTQIDFSEDVAAEFEWATENSRQSISGKKIIAQTSLSSANTIDRFFYENSFNLDQYNLADGSVASLVGFQKDSLICKVLVQSEYDEFSLPTESTKTEVEIDCGILEKQEPRIIINTSPHDPLAMISVNEQGIGIKLYTKELQNKEIVDYFIIETANSNPVKVVVDEKGRSKEVFIEDYVLQFSNYTEKTVDLSVVAPDGKIENAKNLPINKAKVSLIPMIYAANSPESAGKRNDNLDGKYYSDVVGTAWNGVICAGGILTNIIPNPVSTTTAVIGCGTLVSRVTPTPGKINNCSDKSVFDCITGKISSIISTPESFTYLRGSVASSDGAHLIPEVAITLKHKSGSEKKAVSQKYGIYGDNAELPLEKNGAYTLEFLHPEFKVKTLQIVLSDERIKIVEEESKETFVDIANTEDALISLDITLELASGFKAEISTRDSANTAAGIYGDLRGSIEINPDGFGKYECNWELSGTIDYEASSGYGGMHGDVKAYSTSCSGEENADGKIELIGTADGMEPLPDSITEEQLKSPIFEGYSEIVGEMKDIGFKIDLEQKPEGMHGNILISRTSFQGKATEGNENIGSAIRLKRGLNQGIYFLALPN